MINQSDFPIEFSKKIFHFYDIFEEINIQKLIPDFWLEYDPYLKIPMNIKKTNNYSPNKKLIFFNSLNTNLKILCHISHINFSNCILSKTPEINNFMNSEQFYFSELRKISLIYFSISKILIKKNEPSSFKIFSNSWYQNKYISIHNSIFFPDLMKKKFKYF
jgi:hypothetical protein